MVSPLCGNGHDVVLVDYLFSHLGVRILDFQREYNKHKALASASRGVKQLATWLQGS